MSYGITVYYNNEFIESTYFYNYNVSKTGYYGNSSYTVTGLTYSSTFTAYPYDGCVFSHWVYRYVVNGKQSDPMESYSNPFTYDGSQGDLIIRAVGEEEYVEPDDPTWSAASVRSIGKITSEYNRSFYTSEYTLYPHSFTFADSGTARFYCYSDGDTIGYLTQSRYYDSTYGEPDDIITYDDNGSGDFDFTCEVEANTTYYLWVKYYFGDDSGYLDLYIEPPEKAPTRPSNFSWTYAKVKGEAFNLKATEWNNFTSRINAFRAYKGLSNYSFTYAYKGNDFTAAIYNQARKAIQAISGYGTYIPTVSAGQDITAYMMNVLVSELNSIP